MRNDYTVLSRSATIYPLHPKILICCVALLLCATFIANHLFANPKTDVGDEWPIWRGKHGDGRWNAPTLPNTWPEQGLPVVWRQQIGGGYAGVTVADGHVYTMDRQTDPMEVERVLCFSAETGKPLWTHTYKTTYGDLDYGSGPRAAPTVYEGRVYTLGALGHLHCLDAKTGNVIWAKDTQTELNAQIPEWGFAASPLIWKNLVIAHIAAKPNGCYVAFDRLNGNEVWRTSEDPAGYCTPIIITHHGNPQLICWTPENIHGVSPDTGEVYWSFPYKVTYGVSIASPIFQEGIVFVSGYWEGSKAIRLGKTPPDAEMIWTENKYLRGLMSQPLYRQGYVYLLDKSHGLVCFKLQTGEKVWDDANQMTPKDRNPHASMVWTGDTDRVLVLNADGELILARLTPEGYSEQSRTPVIGHTWAHPAFAGDCVFARSDTELVCVRITP